MDGNPKGYEVAEHIATKVEENPRILLTLKNAKSIKSMTPWGGFETSMVRTLGILFHLVKIKIWKGSSKSRIFPGRSYMSPFLIISFSMVGDT